MTSIESTQSPNPVNPNILLEALRFLAARCDGAEAKDSQGFNKPDSYRGKQLAGRDFLSEEETADALQILQKYGSQLTEGHITLPEREQAIVEAREADSKRGEIQFDSSTRLLKIIFPYNTRHIARVKALPKARFNGNGEKYWTVPLSSGKALLETFPKFTTTDEAKSAISAFQPSPYAGKITLDTDGKTLILSFEYDADLVTKVKAIRGAKFSPEKKFWRVPISEWDAAFNRLPPFEIGAGVSDAVIAYRLSVDEQAAKDQAIAISLLKYIDAPLPSGRTLFKHQREGVNFLLEKRRAILADDMGLGKTMQALIAAQAFKLPVIVICPASLKINWQREAAGVGVEISVYSWAKLPAIPDHDFVLIADEAHYAQSLKSKRTQGFIDLCHSQFCVGAYLLTGTPIKNGRPVNLFPLLKATRHPLAENKSEYERYYCDAHATRFTRWDTSGAAHLDELHRKLKDVMIRRMKKECLDLPEKTRVIRPVELSDKAAKTYKENFDKLRAEYRERMDAKGVAISQAEAIVMLNNVRHAGSWAKTDTAIELAQEVIEQGGQVVLFVAFKEPGELIAAELKAPFFSGELATKERQAIVDDFQAGKTKAFVGTLQAGGVGITLTAAQTVILVDRPWTPGDAVQSEDRLHRIGQNSAVTSIWLQQGDTDIAIDDLLQSKQERIDLVLHGKRKTMRGTGSVGDLAQELLPLIMEG